MFRQINDQEDECLEFASTQSLFCNNLLNLKMGSKRGGPRKKTKGFRNPFDLRLGSRVQRKRKGKRAKSIGIKVNYLLTKHLPIFLHDKNADQRDEAENSEATNIIASALELGLEINGGRDEAITVLKKRIEEGEI